jgi:hypothetical protein
MTDYHNQSFFGQTTALILQSSSKHDPWVFFRCIKKKPSGAWEKPSKGEGKIIKCSLEEIVMILKVLRKKNDSWSAYHSYKDTDTQIHFKWDENEREILWIHIGNYSKVLKSAQIEICSLLMTHILQEKIEFATGSKEPQNNKGNDDRNKKREKDPTKSHEKNISKSEKKRETLKIIEEIESEKPIPSQDQKSNTFSKSNTSFYKIEATIKRETPKAFLLEVWGGKEVWVPKSGLKSDFSKEKGISQTFNIKNWIIEKNNIPIQNTLN